LSQTKYNFYSDGGHGWLKVSLDELIKLGIHVKVSACSYIRKDHVYLEEDCDATLFIDAKEKLGEKVEEKSHSQSNKSSKIRNYESFDYFDYVYHNEWQKINSKVLGANEQEQEQLINDFWFTVTKQTQVLIREEDLI